MYRGRGSAAAPAFIEGVGADLRRAVRIDLAANVHLVAEAIRGVLRHRYPRLTRARVTLTSDRATAYEVLRQVVPAGQRIAVDEEVTTIDALRRFLGR